jgi:hypothetical protein
MVYIAALEAQRKLRWRHLKQDSRWRRGVVQLRDGLAEVGQVL